MLLYMIPLLFLNGHGGITISQGFLTNNTNPLTPTDLYGRFQIKAWTIPF